MRMNVKIAAAAVLWTGVAFAPAWAQMGAAKEGQGEVPRGAEVDAALLGAVEIPAPQLSDEAARAAPMLSDEDAVRALGVVTRSSDGVVTRTAAPEAVRKAIEGMAAPGEETRGEAVGGEKAPDPAFAEGAEAQRQVFGADDRVQVTDSTAYPFSTIGLLMMSKEGAEGYIGCSGTLIGPRTVLTAAHCLYDHEQPGGWFKEYSFLPAVNGVDKIPFGAFAVESTTIVQGFVDNYKGSYDTVVPWDLGIVTLKDPLGDYLGWLAAMDVQGLSDFSANIVGYPGDKPEGTMWRATCDVLTENISPELFLYDCDTFQGTSGASVYAYDPSSKSRLILGVNVAGGPGGNFAVRLNGGYIEWINSLYK